VEEFNSVLPRANPDRVRGEDLNRRLPDLKSSVLKPLGHFASTKELVKLKGG